MIKKIIYTGILFLTFSSPVYGQMFQVPDCLNNESRVMIRKLEKMFENGDEELIKRYVGKVEMDSLGYVLSNPKCGILELNYLGKLVKSSRLKDSTKSELLGRIEESSNILSIKDPVRKVH